MTEAFTTIVIAVLPGSAPEAFALRAVLEAAGRHVDLRLIATPAQFRQIVAGRPVPDLLVICGHGADGGLHMGPLSANAGGHELADGFLVPARFAENVALPGCTVLCTACDSGSASLARAFVQGGVRAYIAPAGEPEGSDMLLAAHLVLHGLLRGRDPQAAVTAANAAVSGALALHQGVANAA